MKFEGAKNEVSESTILRHILQLSSWIKGFCNILVTFFFHFDNCAMYRNQEITV